jgi:two-component system, OmpR family, phosphate regulon sensor histidine kinase PhoR
MPKRRLLWHLYPSYAAIVLLAVLGVGWVASRQFEQSYLSSVRENLRARADFLDRQLSPDIPDDRTAFARLCRQLAQASGTRITLILPNGRVDCDSQSRPEELENQLGRPEIHQAILGQGDDAIRYNPALDQRAIYMAVPVFRNDNLFGVLYFSTPLDVLDQSLERMKVQILLVGFAIAACAVVVAWWTARELGRPLGQMRQAVDRLSAGEWGTRVAVPDPREPAALAESLNQMAEQLQQRIGLLVRHNNEQKAVLASMAEGVLAVDNQERVISLNDASGQLLGLDVAQAHGRRLQEVVRNADLSRFISRSLGCEEPIEADVLLHGDRERVMQARGSALHDSEGRAIGAVIVLNDVTDFRKLEDIRRDFVANVSHELKTPVTSIKGFVETLLDGAMKDPDDAERFLRIVAKQADRLHAIIEDLLSLSKIEQSEENADIVLEPNPVRGVIESAMNTCQAIASERNIEVRLDCDAQLKSRLNPLLLEQALVNLLDNAIKYSEPGREVRVAAGASNGEVTISVADRGSGIASEHLPRIFERFYRVDRARSRKMGGTGLGLAIVKHIVQAHHGRVTVESTLGVGSTFTVHLPKA